MPIRTGLAAIIQNDKTKYFDATFDWKMMFLDGYGVMGLIFRQQDPFNFYTFEYSSAKLRFKIIKGGMLSELAFIDQ